MKFKKIKINGRWPKRFIKLLITALLILGAVLVVLFLMSLFFDKYQLKFQTPVIFQHPILIEERKEVLINPLVEVVAAEVGNNPEPQPVLPNGEIEQEIYEVFGEADWVTAAKIFRCESGLDTNARHINTNGSIDAGIPQINSVHGINERWLKYPEISVRIAKIIYDRSGWYPWVCARKLGIIK